jgi:hypothetical protein
MYRATTNGEQQLLEYKDEISNEQVGIGTQVKLLMHLNIKGIIAECILVG